MHWWRGGGKGGTPRVARQPADPTTATPRVAQTRPTPKTLNRKKLREIFRDPPGFGAKPKKLTKSSKTAQRKCDKTKKLKKSSKKAQNRRRDEKKLKKSSKKARRNHAQKKCSFFFLGGNLPPKSNLSRVGATESNLEKKRTTKSFFSCNFPKTQKQYLLQFFMFFYFFCQNPLVRGSA
jgi:hypothetical protein